MFPWIVEVIMVLCNLPGTGLCLKYLRRMYISELPVHW